MGGWCYCCTAVMRLHCRAITLARRRPLARSIVPSIAPSIVRCRRRPGVLVPPSSLSLRGSPAVACPPPPRSLGRLRACSVDHAVDRAPPPSPGRSWAAVVDRPPAPDPSLALSPAIARSPSLTRRRLSPPSLGLPLAAVVARPPSPARSLPRRH